MLLTTSNIEDLKEAANQIIDYMNESIDELQERIVNVNIINDYLKNDDEMVLKYGALIGEGFGTVNTLTKSVDILTLNLHRVVDGEYDFYPLPAIGALLLDWDYQVYQAMQDIDDTVTELEKYMEYFDALEIDLVAEPKKSGPTIH